MTSASDNKKIKILCLLREQHGHVKPVESYMGERAEFHYDADWNPEKIGTLLPDLVLCVNDISFEISLCLDAAKKVSVPSLVLQDGILEWRCQYEHSLFGSGNGPPQHQPVLADKIACLGPQSARQIASWGNVEKVEVTGMPRMDWLRNQKIRPLSNPGKKILVMTARTPWFNKEQRAEVVRSLQDLKESLMKQKDLGVSWRLTSGLEKVLGVQNQLNSIEEDELFRLVESVDAVITTPSTAGVEAMLMGRPTAFLDYFNVPRFVPTAWTISSPEHIAPVLLDLLNPPAIKILFQRDSLNDILRLDRPAAENVGELILKMSEAGRLAREKKHTLVLPKDMLGVMSCCPITPPLSLESLYPSNEHFSKKDPLALQLRLARAEKTLERYKKALASRQLGYWIEKAGRFMMRKIKKEES